MEKIAQFSELDNTEQLAVVLAHKGIYDRVGLVRPADTFMRLFNLGNPTCAINSETKQCRVEGEDSVNVMRLLFREYLV